MRSPCRALLVLICCASGIATADEGGGNLPRAREHFTAARTAYEAGHYDDALAGFRKAYELSPRPEFLINFAQVYRKLGRLDEAQAECERFLAAAPGSPLRAEAQKLLEAISLERASAPPPVRTPLPVTPPPRVAAPAPVKPLPEVFPVDAAPAVASPLVTPAPSAPPVEASRHRAWPWVVGAVAVVIVGAAAVAIAVSQSSTSSFPMTDGALDFRK